MSKIKFEKILLKSFLFISLFLTLAMFSCKRPKISQATFVKCKLRLTDFIKDYYYADIKGISTSHVNYEVTVKVMEKIGNQVTEQRGYYNLKGPTGPDKSIFETEIEVPVGITYRIDVAVKAIECSVKSVIGCNTYPTYGPPETLYGPPTEFLNNAGMPYWLAEQVETTVPSGNVITMRPVPRPSNSDGSGNCGCTIRVK